MKARRAEVRVIKPKAEAPSLESMAQAVQTLLTEIGEDVTRQGLDRTPMRSAKALEFLTSGYRTNIDDIINDAIFDADSDGMVIVRDIEFYSICEHHMLPFFGKMHVAYLPKGRVIGLSKIPRIVDMFARRLQVQEQLTHQVAHAVNSILKPLGVGVIAEARHFCMMMRGVEKQHSGTITSTVLGQFRQKATRDEFLSLVSQKSNPF